MEKQPITDKEPLSRRRGRLAPIVAYLALALVAGGITGHEFDPSTDTRTVQETVYEGNMSNLNNPNISVSNDGPLSSSQAYATGNRPIPNSLKVNIGNTGPKQSIVDKALESGS